MSNVNKLDRDIKRIKDKEKYKKAKKIKYLKTIKKSKEQEEEQNKYKPKPKCTQKNLMKKYILEHLNKKENIQLTSDHGEFVDILASELKFTTHGKERNNERQKQFKDFNGINFLKDKRVLKFMIKVIYNDTENVKQKTRLLITKDFFIVLKEFDNVIITVYPMNYGRTTFNKYYKRYNKDNKIL